MCAGGNPVLVVASALAVAIFIKNNIKNTKIM